MLAELLTAIFLPLLGAFAIAAAPSRPQSGRWIGWVALIFPVVSTILLVRLLLAAPAEGMLLQLPWIPSMNVALDFRVDGLSLFYGLVVSGMGVLVFLYGAAYLGSDYAFANRFFAYLSLFMAAMLGTVFSDSLLLLFTFWELTGLASFLLIGFLHAEEESRRGARMAFIVTVGAGLCMLAGLVLLAQTTGLRSLTALIEAANAEHSNSLAAMANDSPYARAALILILIGAFGKSAQIPFHFWLPNAMAAPTPVSAYLHSATMVKLGVYLAGRFVPIFHDMELWSNLLVFFGFATMLTGALLAVLSHKLKAILAYSTVAQLGSLIGMYGLMESNLVRYDYLHILNHVFYKGCLFMAAGALTHATGAKDIRELGGLFGRLPVLAFIILLGSASMAGIPYTTGFLSKELSLADALAYLEGGGFWGYFPIAAIVLGAALKMAFSMRLFFAPFIYSATPEAERAINVSFHRPGFFLLLPPLLLALAALVFGSAPFLLEPIHAILAVPGMHPADPGHIKIWHGFNLPLALSAGAIGGGAVLFFALQPVWRGLYAPWPLQFDRAFNWFMDWLPQGSARLTAFLQADRPTRYLPILFSFSAGLLLFYLVPIFGGLTLDMFAAYALERMSLHGVRTEGAVRVFVAALMALFVVAVPMLSRWTTQLISLTISGFLLSFYFVLYRAPDLALTQLLVDTALLVLVLLLLARFPLSAQEGGSNQNAPERRLVTLFIAVSVGAAFTLIAMVSAGTMAPERAGDYYLNNTVELAGGGNAVNTILVDFRGLDTLMEVAVFTISALGSLGLLMRYRRRKPGEMRMAKDQADARQQRAVAQARLEEDRAPGPGLRSYIYERIVQVLFFPLMLYSLYLLWRGHNFPGGGFIAGLAASMALVLLSFAIGLKRFHQIIRIDPILLAAPGLLLALLTGLIPTLVGGPYLDQYNFHLYGVPLIGDLHVGTPLLFDIGVFVAVIGVTIKVVFVLAKSVSGLTALVQAEEERYASPLEEPIERPEYAPLHGGSSAEQPPGGSQQS